MEVASLGTVVASLLDSCTVAAADIDNTAAAVLGIAAVAIAVASVRWHYCQVPSFRKADAWSRL